MRPAVACEGREDRRDVPPLRPLAGEEVERGVAQPDRPPRLPDLSGIAGQGTKAWVGTGEDHAEPALADPVDSCHVARGRLRRDQHATRPSRRQAITPAEAPPDMPGK